MEARKSSQGYYKIKIGGPEVFEWCSEANTISIAHAHKKRLGMATQKSGMEATFKTTPSRLSIIIGSAIMISRLETVYLYK